MAALAAVRCPLCDVRRARRSCPALGKEICALCCGTKRLVEIRCPSDCPYLASSREHPPAATTRQQRRDLTLMIDLMRGLNQRQSQLFVRLNAEVLRYEPPDFQTVVDEDVAEAAGALAATLETRARGVIYDHQPASMPAARLMAALKPVVDARSGGSAAEREAAVVLRLLQRGAIEAREADPENKRAYVELSRRVLSRGAESPDNPERPDEPRLIVP